MPLEGYATDWISVFLAAIVAIVGIAGMFIASRLIAPRRPSKIKETPYESGIPPLPLNRAQFNVRYYIFAILFLIFDVEAVFLFPWALIFVDSVAYVFYAMVLFIFILLFGVAYAWRKGVLEWR
ncbi:MAG: NADH:ubiquinone oxidoreductase subunit A [Gammaproteobacteria bacterium]|nr:NADH:ubiquinone oxidoreductase subunit A [Chloroflexota bacterium]MBS25113.1 NADH:ubiquinone oxidoreductase subunit A [Gammaproteobacteria bacterium]|tara:strand:+ start:932 stop:1303 length:372 start_codon:yes stop_codon:yes gene_type:complete